MRSHVRRLLPVAFLVLGCAPLAAQNLPNLTEFSSTAVAAHSGLCMEVPGASTAADLQLTQNTCSARPEQGLRFVPVNGQPQVASIRTAGGLCLAARPAGTVHRTAVVAVARHNPADQRI
ncbi:MAG: RICIN domain-containing protein, partial [Arenimonas sp.]|uniref:RICIN domain-containing protein n=1 Tax=Arenimonas sp. TaxID=1872635 RepID=UPI0025C701C2